MVQQKNKTLEQKRFFRARMMFSQSLMAADGALKLDYASVVFVDVMSAECTSERIFDIGQYMAKIRTNVWWRVILWLTCIYYNNNSCVFSKSVFSHNHFLVVSWTLGMLRHY